MSDFHQLREIAVDELEQVLRLVDEKAAESLAEEILHAKRIFVVGAGRSGLTVRGYAMRLAHLGFTVHVVGDVTSPPIKPEDLLIAVSGSGATRGILQVAETARSIGARIACITTDAGSPLAQMSVCSVVLPASTPKAKGVRDSNVIRSKQPLAGLFEQSSWLFGDIHVALLRDRLGETNESMMARHANLE